MRINYRKTIACCMAMLIIGMAVGELAHSSEEQVCSCCKKACESKVKLCTCRHVTLQYSLPENNNFLKLVFSGVLLQKEAPSSHILFVCDIFHPPKYNA